MIQIRFQALWFTISVRIQVHSLIQEQFDLTNVFRLWEETGEHGGNPHRPELRIESRTLELWGGNNYIQGTMITLKNDRPRPFYQPPCYPLFRPLSLEINEQHNFSEVCETFGYLALPTLQKSLIDALSLWSFPRNYGLLIVRNLFAGDKKTWLPAVQLLELTRALGSYRSEWEKSNYGLIKLWNLRPH